MYRTKKQTRQFDTGQTDDLKAYDELLNNPLISILREVREKLSTKHFGDEGQPTYQEDKLILVVTYEEKVLA